MKEEIVRQIQKNIFVLFKQYDALCRKHSLRYYFLGGTMLGAVRHKGFIPWDDDIDVGMPREDYDKLLQMYKDGSLTSSSFTVFNAEMSPKCSFDFTKMMQKQIINGKEYEIFVDIFPLDGCPYTSEESIRRYYRRFNLLRTFKNSHYMKLDGKNLIKRTAIRLMRVIPQSTYVRWMNRYLKRHSFDSSPSVGNFSGHWQEKEIMRKDVYGLPTAIWFEDDEYFGVAEPDVYLTKMYGNYMKMPSEEERLSHFSD